MVIGGGLPLVSVPEDPFLRKTLFCALALLVFAGQVLAESTLTLDLETPGLSNASPASEAAKAALQVTTVKAQPAERKPIARVGVVTAGRGSIYSRQSTRSRVYSICAKSTPLAVTGQSGSWYGVLMIDGSTGWMQASKIKLLDYGVMEVQTTRGSYASRGGFDRSSAESRNGVVQTALQYLGVPYVYGGNSSASGMDCSAFVKAVFSQYGISLPRTAREQASVGTPVSWEQVQPGDRLYFAARHDYVDHCGIYIGNGYFVHASAARGGVGIDTLTSKFYANSLVAAMR